MIEAIQPIEIAFTKGVAVGGKLRECHGARLTQTEIVFPETFSLDRWQECGRFLRATTEALPFWRASWLREGHRRFTPEELQSTVEQLGFSFEELNQMTLLTFIPVDHVTALLSAQHHVVVGQLIMDGELPADMAGHWLGVGAAEKLSPSELRESITAGEIVRHTAGGSNRDGHFSIDHVGTMFTGWQRQMPPVAAMPLPLAKQIATRLEPMVRMYQELTARLSQSEGAK